MLTRKQHMLLEFIEQHQAKHGVSPSFEEMKVALDLKSKSGIHRLILALEERGYIRRLAHRARALEILKSSTDTTIAERKTMRPRVIEGGFQRRDVPLVPAAETVTLPLYGRIAAGRPIEALSDPGNTVEVPRSYIGKGEHFALEVAGESMIEAGILDGDVAIVRRVDTAENGAVVVALVDDNEATLKRLRRHGNAIALEPANKEYKTQILPSNRVKVQGRLVSLLRHYR